MGSSLSISCAVALVIEGDFETMSDFLYQMELGDEYEDWDSWEDNCFAEHLGVVLPEICPDWDKGVEKNMPYYQQRKIQEKNYTDWKNSNERIEYERISDLIRGEKKRIGVKYDSYGVMEYCSPVFIIESTEVSGYYETIEIPTVEITDEHRKAFEEYCKITKLPYSGNVKYVAYASYG